MNKKQELVFWKGVATTFFILCLIFAIFLGSTNNSSERDACIELLAFNLNITQYSADRLNITTDQLIEDFVRVEINKYLEESFANQGSYGK